MRNKLFKNIIRVTISNLTTIVTGVLLGFALPKILSIDDYGYYKTFTLYISYIGFFSLGIMDGILLKYGDYDLEKIDKVKFRSYFLFLLIVLIISTLLIINSIWFIKNLQFKIILFFISINIIIINITGYFQHISQITQRFKEYAFRNIIKSVFSIISIVILYILFKSGNNASYYIFLIIITLSNLLMFLWYIITYKNLIFGEKKLTRVRFEETIELSRIGIPLMFSNLCITLIFNLDKQFVNILFPNSDYAIYSFAYSIFSIITMVVSAISTVLYPMLKRSDSNELVSNYSKTKSVIISIVFFSLCLYFPLCIFIGWFLPQYLESLVILRIIFPGLAFTCVTTILIHNYYKVFDLSKKFFFISLIVLVIAFFLHLLAYIIFKKTIVFAITSVITLFIWNTIAETNMKKVFYFNNTKNLLYLIIMCAIFYLFTFISNYYLSLILYLLFYLVVTILFNYKEINNFIRRRKS